MRIGFRRNPQAARAWPCALALLLLSLGNPCPAQQFPNVTGAFLDAAFDSADGRLYAVTGFNVGANTLPEILEIDPTTAKVFTTLSLDSSDARIHLSPDGKYLYVISNSYNSLIRLRLPGLAADKQFSLVAAVSAIAVSPLDSRTFAIVTATQQGSMQITLYRDDAPLPDVAVLPGLYSNPINDMYFDSTGQLYALFGGIGNVVGEGGIQHFAVGETGLAVAEPIHQFYRVGSRVKQVGNLLFTGNALVIDPRTWQPLGRFFQEFKSVPFDADPLTGEAYYIDSNYLFAFSTKGFQLQSQFNLGADYAIYNYTIATICGPNLIAMGGEDYLVFVPRTALVPVAPAKPSVTTLNDGVLQLVQPSSAMAFDPNTKKAYLAISGLAGAGGNSVLTIDTDSLAIEKTTPVGSEPSVLALSSTGQTLHVGLQGTASVTSLSTTTMTSVRNTPLTDTTGYAAPALSLAAVPGAEDFFVAARDAVSNGSLPPSTIAPFGTLAYQAGNVLPGTFTTGTLFPGSSPGQVYETDEAVDGLPTPVEFLVNNSGLSVALTHPKPVDQYSVIVGGKIFDPVGRLYTFGIAQRQGIFYSLDQGPVALAFDQDLSHIYIGTTYGNVTGTGVILEVLVIDCSTLLPVSFFSTTVPLVNNTVAGTQGVTNSGFDLVQTGSAVLFRFSGMMFRVPNSALAPIPPAQTSVQTTPTGALTLNLPVNGFVAVPGTDSVMFTVSLSVPGIGGRIGTWNTDTNSVTYSDFLGGELADLTVSGDRSQLMVSDLARQSVRAFSLPNLKQIDELIPDPTFNEDSFAGSLEPVPGSAHSLFLYLVGDDGEQGVAMLEGTPTRLAQLPGGVMGDFNSSGNRFYGFNTADSGFWAYRFSVDNTGFHLLSETSSPFADGFFELSTFQSGLMYLAVGRVVDPERETIVGKYDLVSNFQQVATNATVVLPDTASERVYFFTYGALDTVGGDGATLLAFDQRTFRFLGSVDLLPGTEGVPSKLAKIGSNSLGALAGSSLAVYNISHSFRESYPLPVATPAQGVRQSVQDIALVNTGAVVDASRGLIYAAIPAAAGELGPSVVTINSTTFAIQSFASLSADPEMLALSDDGSRLYVALQGTTYPILVLDTATGLPLRTLQAPLNFTQPYPPGLAVMAVLPGKPDSLLTGWANGYYYVVFDGDSAVQSYLDPYYGPASVAFTGPETFAGLDNSTSLVPLYLEQIASDGSVSTKVTRDAVAPFEPSNIAYSGGKLFLAAGEVLDASSLSTVGNFPVDSPRGAVLPDLDHNSVYFATGGATGPLTLEQFEAGAYTKKNDFPIPTDGVVSQFSAPVIIQIGATSFVKVTSTDLDVFDVSGKVTYAPVITAVNGVEGALSPGAAASVRGERMSHYMALSPAPNAWTDLAGVSVLVDGERAYITSVNPGDIRIVLPADIPVGAASFQVVVDQNLSPTFQATVVKPK